MIAPEPKPTRSTPPTILVVDDDAGLLRLIKKILEREGYSTLTVTSGRDALACLSAQSVDLMLIDLNLPDMPGRDVIEQLSDQTVPFVVITGLEDVEVAVEMMKRGAADYLVKGAQFLDFVPTVVRKTLSQLEREKRLAAAEEALKKEHDFTTAVLNTSGALVLVLDREGRIVRFNQACETITGYTFLEVKDRPIWELFLLPEEFDDVKTVFQHLIDGHLHQEHENRWRTRDGSERVIAWSNSALLDDSGRVSYVIAAGIDITERKDAERRLEVQFAISRILVERGRFSEAAPKLLQAISLGLGWEFGEVWLMEKEELRREGIWNHPALDGSPFLKLRSGVRIKWAVGLVGRVWSTHQPAWIYELAADENFPWAVPATEAGLHSAFAFPIVNNKGLAGVVAFFSRRTREPDAPLLEILSDIGRRIGQSIERQESEEALRQSEANYRTAQELARFGSFEISVPSSSADYWSPQTYRILGLDPASGAVPLDRFFRQFVHRADRTRTREELEKTIADGSPFDIEYRVVRPDKSLRFVRSTGGPVRDRDGKVTRLVGMLLDVTERKALEQEIARTSEMEQRRIGQDLHDGLCQHLAGIEFMSQVLEQKLAARSKGNAARAAEIAKLVRQAIAQTRDLARGLSPVDLAVEGLMSALQELASNTEKLFHVSCPFLCPEPVLVPDNSVATHLYRIAQEGIRNAIQHGKAKRITLELLQSSDQILLSISDNGRGLLESRDPHRGMGFRIMQYRAGVIGGSLVFESRPKKGTTVLCTIPTPSE